MKYLVLFGVLFSFSTFAVVPIGTEFIKPAEYSYEFEEVLYPVLEKFNFLDPLGKTIAKEQVLMWAINHNKIELVKSILKEKPDVMHRGGMPIEAAASHGNNEIIELLIQAGAKIDEGNYKSLRAAVEFGHLSTVKLLQSKGVDISNKELYLISSALESDNREMINYVLSQKVPKEDFWVFFIYYSKDLDYKLKVMEKYGYETSQLYDGMAFYALQKADFKKYDWAISRGAKVSMEEKQQILPTVVRNDNLKSLKFLLNEKVDVSYNDNEAVKWAIRKRNYKTERILIAAGAPKIEGKERFLLKMMSTGAGWIFGY